ncbi:hypothetical protein B0H34DRAFT_730692 [Crassisporium funariophilum]|nr:hypothetical protein B0H34DRAFT_730692 [Crassisporium funariophilum]
MGESLTDFSDYLSRVSASSLNYFEPLGSHEPNDLDHLPTQETQSPQISESGVSLVPEPLRDLVAIEVATFVPYLEVRFGRITYRSPSSGLCFSGLNNNSVIQTHPAEGVSSGCIDPLQTLFSVDGALDMIPYHKAKVSFANEHIPGFTSLISEDANVIQNVISYPPVACYFRDEQVIHPDPQGFAVDTTQEFILKGWAPRRSL